MDAAAVSSDHTLFGPADACPEPLRGGRGGRGGFRGRGAFANTNGHKASGSFPTTTATTTDAWADQLEQSEAAQDDGEWSTAADAASTVKADLDSRIGEGSTPPAELSRADDFSAAGGFGDAPAPKEVERASKIAQSSTAPKPKLTWAQIVK